MYDGYIQDPNDPSYFYNPYGDPNDPDTWVPADLYYASVGDGGNQPGGPYMYNQSPGTYYNNPANYTINPGTPMGSFLTGAAGGGTGYVDPWAQQPTYYSPAGYGAGYGVGSTIGSGYGASAGTGDPYYNAGATVGGAIGTGSALGGAAPGIQNPAPNTGATGGYTAGYGIGATAGGGLGAAPGTAGGSAPINNYVTVQNPAPAQLGATGGGDMSAYWNQAAAAAQAQAAAQMYGADKTYAVGMANNALGYQQTANDLQARLAAVNAQLASVDASLQNAQLDATARTLLEQMRNDLGYYQADMQDQWQQADQAYKYLSLAQQGQLGAGGLAIQGMDAETRRLLGLGQLDMQSQQLGLQAMTDLGQLDLQRTLGLGNLGISAQDQALRYYQGLNQVDLANRQMGLDTMLGLGGQDIQRMSAMGNIANQQGQLGLQTMLGMGNMGLDYQRFGFAREQAGQENAMRQAEFAASLRGPRDAFAQQAYLHGLDQNGVSRSVGAIRGDFNQPRTEGLHAPVEPATPATFQQDTGITLPGAITSPNANGLPVPAGAA